MAEDCLLFLYAAHSLFNSVLKAKTADHVWLSSPPSPPRPTGILLTVQRLGCFSGEVFLCLGFRMAALCFGASIGCLAAIVLSLFNFPHYWWDVFHITFAPIFPGEGVQGKESSVVQRMIYRKEAHFRRGRLNCDHRPWGAPRLQPQLHSRTIFLLLDRPRNRESL